VTEKANTGSDAASQPGIASIIGALATPDGLKAILSGLNAGGGRGGNIATASSSSSAVSVNPNITVIGGSGSANPSSGGYATSSPNASAVANPNPPWQGSYGFGAGVYPQADVDVSQYRLPGSASIIPGVDDWLLIGGLAVAAWAFVTYGPGSKGGR